MKKYIFLILLTPFMGFSQPQRFYVDDNATGANTGQSWSDAYTNLHDALALAVQGDEIWVAEGVYLPSSTGDRSARFELSTGVKLYGGFAGNEFFLDEREPASHATVLSGDVGVHGDSLDNSYNILYLLQPAMGTEIDGFILENGLANNSASNNGSPGFSGSALYIKGLNGVAYPVIRNCVFRNNTSLGSGGAVYVNGGGSGSVAPVFEKCGFYQNRSAIASGGAIYRAGGSWVERPNDILGCVFEGNYCKRVGGAIYFEDSERSDTFQINRCEFKSNRSDVFGDAVGLGSLRENRSFLYINNSSFEGHNWNGTIETNQISTGGDLGCKIDSCIFFKNLSAPGAGSNPLISIISVYGRSTLDFTHSLIDSCGDLSTIVSFEEYDDKSNRIFIDDITIKNTISANLITTYASTSISNFKVIGSRFSEFVSRYEAIMIATNGVFFNNEINDFMRPNQAHATLSNLVCINNNLIGGALDESGHLPSFYNCIFSGNTFLDGLPSGSIIIPSGFISSEPEYYNCITDNDMFYGSFDATSLTHTFPQFVDSINGDFRLLPCSPGRDQGDNAIIDSLHITTDLSGQPRIQDGIVDIGAYETPGFALAAPPKVIPACSDSPGGSILLTPASGCEPLTYTWSPPAGNGAEINALPPGSYAFTVTDASGRSLHDMVQIGTAPSPVLIANTTQDVSCGSLLGGSASAQASSGTAPYQFLWDNGGVTPQQSMLSAGAHSVTVTDASGCQDSAQIHIQQSGQITLQVDGQPISCFGASDAQLSATAATGKAPFTYQWSQGATDSLLSPLGPGQYTVTVSDAYGCTATFSFNLSDPPPLQAAAIAQPTNNLQNPSGSVTAIPSGGTPTHTYAWSNGGLTQTINNLPPGLYTVTVTDAHGCSATATAEVKLVISTGEAPGLAVQVWPNPMRERLDIEALQLPAGTYRFVLRDVLGREVAAAVVAGGRAVLATGDLSPGAYLWYLETEDGVLASGKVLR